MGACCSSDKEVKALKKTLQKYYKFSIHEKIQKYTFDTAVRDQFAGRVARENNTTVTIAKVWIKYYIAYMIYIGWTFGFESKRNPKLKLNSDINIYLTIPYEILQVWKIHVLFTDKYKEFCLLVTNGKKEFIPFQPPRKLWKNGDLESMQKTFRFNREMILTFYPTEKKEIDSLFIFQASYLKNRINYCLEDNSETLVNITSKFNEELGKEKNGVFSIEARSLVALKNLANKIEGLVKQAIIPENYPGGEDWVLFDKEDKSAALKVPVFQNMSFPSDFVTGFCEEHILSMEKGLEFINNYKKFMFLINVTKQTQTPSEEVDLVWHYHQLYLDDYIAFSKDIMARPILSHMPAIGEKDEPEKFKEQYNNTINSLNKYFGSANPNIWPPAEKRFNQSFKWFNHHNILQRCDNFTKRNELAKTKNRVIVENEVYFIPGCYIGCGLVYGAAFIGCGAIIGCGAHYHSGCGGYVPHDFGTIHNACNSGGSGCHSACSGHSGCGASGCSAGAGSGCSGGASGCGGSGCGGGGCGGGGCGGGCGGG